MTQAMWDDTVKPGLRGMTRAVFSPATYVSNSDTTLTLSLPNPVHRDKCEQHRQAVEKALAASVGSPVTLDLVISGGAGGSGGSVGGDSSGPSGPSGSRGADQAPAGDREPIDPSHPAAGSLADDHAESASVDDGPQASSAAPSESPRRAAERKAAEAAANGSAVSGDDDDVVVTDAEIHVLPEDHEVDMSELVDAPPESVKTPIDRLAEAFPGSELMTETY